MNFSVAGFLFGKMGFVTSTNASKPAVDILKEGLELMSSSRCPMKFTITEKGEKYPNSNYIFRWSVIEIVNM